MHRCEKKKTEGSNQIIKEEKYRFSVCTLFQLHGLWPSLWCVGCKCSKRKQLHWKDYFQALKDCIQAATLNKLYRTADKTQRGKSGGQSWRVGRSKKKSKFACTTCWNWCSSRLTLPPSPNSPQFSHPSQTQPSLPQLALSRKINDLQVQAQHGARVNLARVGEMF